MQHCFQGAGGGDGGRCRWPRGIRLARIIIHGFLERGRAAGVLHSMNMCRLGHHREFIH